MRREYARRGEGRGRRRLVEPERLPAQICELLRECAPASAIRRVYSFAAGSADLVCDRAAKHNADPAVVRLRRIDQHDDAFRRCDER